MVAAGRAVRWMSVCLCELVTMEKNGYRKRMTDKDLYFVIGYLEKKNKKKTEQKPRLKRAKRKKNTSIAIKIERVLCMLV